jgi:aldehyde dehydrogenase (NAD+)
MEDTSKEIIQTILENQRSFFATNQTKDIKFRIANLKKFRSAIRKYEKNIADALWTDLHKSYEEAYLTEINIVISEIDNHIRNLKFWSKQESVETPFVLFPSSSKIIYEPLGVALIIAPWNYPFQLLMNPLVGAISAGCTAILKPSPYTPATAKVMGQMIHETFSHEYISMVQGSRKVNEILLQHRFDIIFFTGSPSLGKVVMKAAAEYLTPVVLELGGKSPCIVDEDADIEVAAKRIAWGKTINAGQTCIAPDFLIVHKEVKDTLIKKIAENIEKMYGKNIKGNRFFPRIVNEQAFDRIIKLMEHGNIKFGGDVDRKEKYISPTIIDDIIPDYPVMQEEIFGPVLPVITFEDINEAIIYLNSIEKPLAFYYFGKNKIAKNVIYKTTSGGACINDTIMHIVNHELPFGGVGNSGQGKYHGKYSFLAFSNARAIVTTPTWLDLPLRYVPFKYFRLIKKII